LDESFKNPSKGIQKITLESKLKVEVKIKAKDGFERKNKRN